MQDRNPLFRLPRRSKSCDFRRNDEGIAAVEFAFILPLLLLIYFGIVEISAGVRASQQLDVVAHSVGDLVGQLPNSSGAAAQLTDSGSTSSGQNYGISQVFAAGAALLQPYSTTSLQMTVSEVLISLNSSGQPQATVDWTVASRSSATQRSCNNVTLGSTLQASTFASMPSSYTSTSSVALGPVIVVDLVYTYTPRLALIAGLFGGASGVTMRRTTYTAVRNTYANTTHPYLYNHIQYALTSTPNATNCLSPTT
jgi:Flp pilus assembly protein TadG